MSICIVQAIIPEGRGLPGVPLLPEGGRQGPCSYFSAEPKEHPLCLISSRFSFPLLPHQRQLEANYGQQDTVHTSSWYEPCRLGLGKDDVKTSGN